MSRSSRLGIAAALLLFLGLAVYSTFRLDQVTVEVCMEFKNRTQCGTAAAPTEEEAIRTATDNACALISSGMTDSMACSRTPPKSIRRFEE